MKLLTVLSLLLASAFAAPVSGEVDTAQSVDDLMAHATNKTLVSPAVYEDFVKYATFARASSIQPCRKPPLGSTLVQEFSIASTDTQASLYKLDNTKELVLAFPGSASLQDFFFTNALIILLPAPDLFPKCSSCFIHTGFANAFRSIVPTLNATLADAVEANPDYKIVVAGHSLGGALAKLAFAYFKSSAAFGSRMSAGYSYGEPRNADARFANYVDDLAGVSGSDPGTYHRVTHANDIVPQTPLPLGYRHSSTEYWEQNQDSTGKPSASSTYRCYGQEPLDCNNAQFFLPDTQAHTTYPGLDVSACS